MQTQSIPAIILDSWLVCFFIFYSNGKSSSQIAITVVAKQNQKRFVLYITWDALLLLKFLQFGFLRSGRRSDSWHVGCYISLWDTALFHAFLAVSYSSDPQDYSVCSSVSLNFFSYPPNVLFYSFPVLLFLSLFSQGFNTYFHYLADVDFYYLY